MEVQENPIDISTPNEEPAIIKGEGIGEDEPTIISKPIVTPELVEEWKRWFLAQKFSLDTVDMYYSFIKRYVGYKVLVNQKTLDRFREMHMGTVSSGALKSLFKFLVYKKNFPESLLLLRFEKNRQTRKEPNVISPEEVEKIINQMDSIKHKLLTQTIYALALRVEEAFKLLWSDFEWAEWLKNKESSGIVHLRKTKRGKFRNLPVNPGLMNNLYNNHSLRTSEGVPIGSMVFGDFSKFNEIMEDKREDEKLKDEQLKERNRKYYLNLEKQKYRDVLYNRSLKAIGRRISPHVLRHGQAMFLMDNNTPIETIKEFLGHDSIATTQIYARVSAKRLQEDMKKFGAISKEINKEDVIKVEK